MQQSLFPLDEKFLYAIVRLEEDGNADWAIIRDKIYEVSELTDQNSLHTFPDVRMNYTERSNVLKGFGIALSLLKNIFKNPSQLVTELKEQDDFLEAQEKVREDGLSE